MSERIGKLISILHRKGQIYLNKELKKYDVVASEVPILLALYKKDGMTQDELGAYACLDKSAVTRIIQSLLKKNYIIKVKDQDDLRCNRIYITPQGFLVKEPLEKVLDAWHQNLMKGLESSKQTEVLYLLGLLVENTKGANYND